MHNNFYLLQQLAPQLKDHWQQSKIAACYSQDKDELVLVFTNKEHVHFLHAVLRADLSLLRFPQELQRARKNTIDLFPEILDLSIEEVFCFQNERCLCLKLQDSWSMLFKMFGRQANIILCRKNVPVDIFKKQLKNDLHLTPEQLNRDLEITKERLNEVNGEFQKMIPTLGSAIKQHLGDSGYYQADPDSQWRMLKQLLSQLSKPVYYLHWVEHLPVLTLFDPGNSFFKTDQVMEALNEYYRFYVKSQGLSGEKQKLERLLNQQKKRASGHVKRLDQRLSQIRAQVPFQTIADLIMAYMHKIPAGASQVTLQDFESNLPLEIKLKSNLSPQKNAEYYYRKSKNQQKEIRVLNENKKLKENELGKIAQHLSFISPCQHLKELRAYNKEHQIEKAPVKAKEAGLFKRFIYLGYTILVGKNAANNDLLTQRHSHKDDLWLHAKDVKGSHVLIKHLPGKAFPSPVIERAAQLAAYYSKRKQDSLCPVAYTPKKFVRKPKGSPPGQVILDKEQVILVVPRL